jgi:hypothetical protein
VVNRLAFLSIMNTRVRIHSLKKTLFDLDDVTKQICYTDSYESKNLKIVSCLDRLFETYFVALGLNYSGETVNFTTYYGNDKYILNVYIGQTTLFTVPSRRSTTVYLGILEVGLNMTFEFAKTHPPLPAQLAKILRLWSCGYLRTITNIVPTIKLARIEYIKKNVSFLLMKGYSIQITYAKNKQPERMVTSDDLTSC